jgi:diguanylate cyclase (GGDEF)-like protein
LLWVLGFLIGHGVAHAQARIQDPLLLDDAHPVVGLWPALRMLSDPAGTLTVGEAAARAEQFQAMPSPVGSMGPRRDVLWLYLPLQVAAGDGRWVLDIDYPALNEVQVFLLVQGHWQVLPRLGSTQPFGSRPMPTRSHALSLQLLPGHRHELMLRVKTDSAMVLPITLNKPDTLHVRESRALLSQGLMLGVSLALLVYSLAYGLSLREPLFALYALMLLGSSAFFVDFYGVGQLVLWSERRGWVAMISPLSVLLAMGAGAQFVSRSMDMRQRHPGLYRGMQALSAIATVLLLAGLLGLISYREAQLAATFFGPAVPLLIIPAAWKRARQGEHVGRYMLLGWGAYLAGALTMAALLRGLLPATFWTLHLFQWGTTVEMLAWLRVLGLYIEAVRSEARRSAAETRHLESLAQTDPLTGLPNRRGLQTELQAALADSSATRQLAVFMADLDGFKAVNDRLGHAAGDELLVQVASRLQSQLRHGDTVARLGGDEFVILVRGLADEVGAQSLGSKLLTAFDTHFVVQGQPCRVGLTVGYALGPQDGVEGAQLLQVADAAMYAGKQAGRHQVRRGEAVRAQA